MSKIVLTGAVILSLTLTLSTVFIPVTLISQDELVAVQLGHPFPFVTQNFSRYTPLFFPVRFNIGSPWEDPFKLNKLNFFGSWAVFFCGVTSIFLLVKYFKKVVQTH